MKNYSQTMTVGGHVTSINAPNRSFSIQARSGDVFDVVATDTCWFWVMTNLDDVNRDSVPPPEPGPEGEDGVSYNIRKYIRMDEFIVVEGTYMEHGDKKLFSAEKVNLLSSQPDRVLFEETHWWLAQISQMANKWLDNLFQDRRTYRIDDFSEFYRTNLNIEGMPTDNSIQECATLSRLIYGLSSAYLLTGNERYYLAAKAGVAYQREAFRQLSHDGRYIFWAYGRRKLSDGSVKLVVPSQNGDDINTIPLYEQIYALAGLAQYFRISLDWEVLEDIRRTVNSFQAFYYDGQGEEYQSKGFPGHGGYFSHIDPDTMRPDSIQLGDDKNRSRKNWNSVGDHIPAYLINLILALDPPSRGAERRQLQDLLATCRQILQETSEIIIEKFPDPSCAYVNERFFADWRPDHNWFWQQNRAVVGHNLKIAWNLTRVANYYQVLEKQHRDRREIPQADAYRQRSEQALALAHKLGEDMVAHGLDQIRPGVFDCVEREPKNGMPIQFTWGNHKDFWQQEQGILAYLILHGNRSSNPLYIHLARELMAFWNLYFLDRDRQGIFFRTTESGEPIIQGSYSDKGGHSISGYHAFELNFLAHLYIRAYVVGNENKDPDFCLYFRVSGNSGMEAINVLPDFYPPGKLRITSVRIDGIERPDLIPNAPDIFQIPLEDPHRECQIAVQFAANP